MSPKKLEAVNNDDRKIRVVLLGLEDTNDEILSGRVDGMLALSNKPTVSDCYRVGPVKQGASRPVKMLFNSSEAAARALRSSSGLKLTSNYSKVFIAPERTPEKRNERKN